MGRLSPGEAAFRKRANICPPGGIKSASNTTEIGLLPFRIAPQKITFESGGRH